MPWQLTSDSLRIAKLDILSLGLRGARLATLTFVDVGYDAALRRTCIRIRSFRVPARWLFVLAKASTSEKYPNPVVGLGRNAVEAHTDLDLDST